MQQNDLNSRKALLDAIDESDRENNHRHPLIFKIHHHEHLHFMNMVLNAPSVETNPKWIPVTERLPDLIPCNAGTAYSEAVNILTSGRKVLTAIWNGSDFIADAKFWEAEGEEITHWTPVLLPLPEPPKEGT